MYTCTCTSIPSVTFVDEYAAMHDVHTCMSHDVHTCMSGMYGMSCTHDDSCAHLQLDWVSDKLRVFLDHFLDPPLLQILHLVLLQGEDDPRAPTEPFQLLVPLHCERTSSRGLPQILFVVIVLCGGGGKGAHDVDRLATKANTIAQTHQSKL